MGNRQRRTMLGWVAAAASVLIVVSCGSSPLAVVPDAVTPAAPGASGPYDDQARWICRPDKADVCDDDLDATVVRVDGTTSVERWAPAKDPAVDCFYVYPTVSKDPGTNSDLVPGALEEIRAVRAQVARYGSTCRVFAPLYRELTVAGVQSLLTGSDPPATTPASSAAGTKPAEIAYGDVVDAFRNYVARDSNGRGFILVGHSQGSSLLAELLNKVIVPDPALRGRLVSAYLIGLPGGVQPDAAGTPPCTSATQTGCVVAYSSFRSTAPPDAGTIFARTRPGAEADPARCTNPAELVGSSPATHPYFPANEHAWVDGSREITTEFVTTPGLVTAACVQRDPFSWLQVTVNSDPNDRRAHDVPGDLIPGWGLHWADMQLLQGDLIELAGRQGAAWRAAHPSD
jgi:hypothetical protein